MIVSSQIVDATVPSGALRIAFASSDGTSVNDHFGKGMEFLLFDVTPGGFGKSGKITFQPEATDPKEHSEKNFTKVDALSSCHIVYSASIGGPVAAKLTQRKIQPLVVKGEDRIERLLEDFQKMLQNPPRWIAKLIGAENPNRFEQFDEEEE